MSVFISIKRQKLYEINYLGNLRLMLYSVSWLQDAIGLKVLLKFCSLLTAGFRTHYFEIGLLGILNISSWRNSRNGRYKTASDPSCLPWRRSRHPHVRDAVPLPRRKGCPYHLKTEGPREKFEPHLLFSCPVFPQLSTLHPTWSKHAQGSPFLGGKGVFCHFFKKALASHKTCIK